MLFTDCFVVNVVILERTAYYTPNQTRIHYNGNAKEFNVLRVDLNNVNLSVMLVVKYRLVSQIINILKGVLKMAFPNCLS